MAGLDDPAAGAPARRADLFGDLLAAGTDVRRELVVADEVADFGVVVGPVEAEALRGFWGRLGALDWDRVERALQEEVVVAVRTVVVEPDRDSRPLTDDRSFRPFLALSVGFGPVASPPSGAFPVAPSQDNQAQSIPTTWSYSNRP